MPCVGFEPKIPVFEVAKTDHALDRAATVTGTILQLVTKFLRNTMAYYRVYKGH
jgi:hypothetical protein